MRILSTAVRSTLKKQQLETNRLNHSRFAAPSTGNKAYTSRDSLVFTHTEMVELAEALLGWVNLIPRVICFSFQSLD